MIIFFIASVNKIMNNIYGLPFNVMIESTLKVPVNNFSHVWTPYRGRQKKREREKTRMG